MKKQTKIALLSAISASAIIIPAVAATVVSCSNDTISTSTQESTPIKITSQSQNQTAYQGQTENLPEFYVNTTGGNNLEYQWYFSSEDTSESNINQWKEIPGNSSNTYKVTSEFLKDATLGSTYFYYVQIKSDNQVVDSNVFTLQINAAKLPTITITNSQPNSTITMSPSGTFSAISIETNPISNATINYQWYYSYYSDLSNPQKITGATSDTFTPYFPSGMKTNQEIYFYCVVSGTYNGTELTPVTSNYWGYILSNAPVSVSNNTPVKDQTATVYIGSNFTKTYTVNPVINSGVDVASKTFKWFWINNDSENASNNYATFVSSQDSTNYNFINGATTNTLNLTYQDLVNSGWNENDTNISIGCLTTFEMGDGNVIPVTKIVGGLTVSSFSIENISNQTVYSNQTSSISISANVDGASISDGASYKYTWYESDTAISGTLTSSSGVVVTTGVGANGLSSTLTISSPFTKNMYYFVEVTETINGKTYTKFSNVTEIIYSNTQELNLSIQSTLPSVIFSNNSWDNSYKLSILESDLSVPSNISYIWEINGTTLPSSYYSSSNTGNTIVFDQKQWNNFLEFIKSLNATTLKVSAIATWTTNNISYTQTVNLTNNITYSNEELSISNKYSSYTSSSQNMKQNLGFKVDGGNVSVSDIVYNLLIPSGLSAQDVQFSFNNVTGVDSTNLNNLKTLLKNATAFDPSTNIISIAINDSNWSTLVSYMENNILQFTLQVSFIYSGSTYNLTANQITISNFNVSTTTTTTSVTLGTGDIEIANNVSVPTGYNLSNQYARILVATSQSDLSTLIDNIGKQLSGKDGSFALNSYFLNEKYQLPTIGKIPVRSNYLYLDSSLTDLTPGTTYYYAVIVLSVYSNNGDHKYAFTEITPSSSQTLSVRQPTENLSITSTLPSDIFANTNYSSNYQLAINLPSSNPISNPTYTWQINGTTLPASDYTTSNNGATITFTSAQWTAFLAFIEKLNKSSLTISATISGIVNDVAYVQTINATNPISYSNTNMSITSKYSSYTSTAKDMTAGSGFKVNGGNVSASDIVYNLSIPSGLSAQDVQFSFNNVTGVDSTNLNNLKTLLKNATTFDPSTNIISIAINNSNWSTLVSYMENDTLSFTLNIAFTYDGVSYTFAADPVTINNVSVTTTTTVGSVILGTSNIAITTNQTVAGNYNLSNQYARILVATSQSDLNTLINNIGKQLSGKDGSSALNSYFLNEKYQLATIGEIPVTTKYLYLDSSLTDLTPGTTYYYAVIVLSVYSNAGNYKYIFTKITPSSTRTLSTNTKINLSSLYITIINYLKK